MGGFCLFLSSELALKLKTVICILATFVFSPSFPDTFIPADQSLLAAHRTQGGSEDQMTAPTCHYYSMQATWWPFPNRGTVKDTGEDFLGID